MKLLAPLLCCCLATSAAFSPIARTPRRTAAASTRLWTTAASASSDDSDGPRASAFESSSNVTTTAAAVEEAAPVVGGGDPENFLIPKRPKSPTAAWKCKLAQIGMYLFIASMCVALPATLLPQNLLHRLGLISRLRRERWALATGQWCARWLLRLIPFCRIDVQTHYSDENSSSDPAVWVCNHTSALDIFLLLATDRRLRGEKKRPIKIVYWEQLEENPVTKLLFKQCGFIPVGMSDNGNGTDNDYDVASFKRLLQQSKQAFEDGFDIGILPEGQLNPTPEKGLLPSFAGAYTLARLSRPRRPIRFMAMHGAQQLWHPDPNIGFTNVSGRHVLAKVYDNSKYDMYKNSQEFLETFNKVVGHFGATGEDLEEEDLSQFLAGTHPLQEQARKAPKKGKKE